MLEAGGEFHFRLIATQQPEAMTENRRRHGKRRQQQGANRGPDATCHHNAADKLRQNRQCGENAGQGDARGRTPP